MVKAGVVVFPGSNCDFDTYYVLKELLRVHTKFIWYEETRIENFNLIFLPGGFSYGDYLRCGAIARFAPLVKTLEEYIGYKRGYVIGICNGFQILTEAHLLKGALLRNEKQRFICKTVSLRIENNNTAFTNRFEPGEIIELPIAHSDGRYYTREYPKIKNQVFLRYTDNPNGSLQNIAGIMNESGNVFGMMPHPERNAETILGCGVGKKFFASLLWTLK